MRLGELLLKKGVVTPEQLTTALHEQKRFAGRLGTNLVHLGYLDVDTVARALSVQRGFPGVLREHIAAIDPRALALFPPRIVSTYKVVPIGYTTSKPSRVVVACVDPATIPLDELAFAAGARIEPWIAPEMLIQECMERYFGAPAAPARYVSVKLDAHDASSLASLRLPTAADVGPVHVSKPPAKTEARPSTPAKGRARVLSPPPPPPTIAEPPAPQAIREPPEPPAIREPPAPPAILEPPAPPLAIVEPEDELPPESQWEAPEAPEESAAIPLEPRPVTAPPEAMLRPVIDRAQASMLLEMATSKEQIGRTLEDWLRSTFGCGLVLVVKGDTALGWRGFFPDADDRIEAVTIPLGTPSMFAVANESRAPFRGQPPEEGAMLQNRLWKLLRCPPQSEVLVCPVVLGKRAVNLLYAHMEDGTGLPDDLAEDAAALCADAAAAYARLIERKKR